MCSQISNSQKVPILNVELFKVSILLLPGIVDPRGSSSIYFFSSSRLKIQKITLLNVVCIVPSFPPLLGNHGGGNGDDHDPCDYHSVLGQQQQIRSHDVISDHFRFKESRRVIIIIIFMTMIYRNMKKEWNDIYFVVNGMKGEKEKKNVSWWPFLFTTTWDTKCFKMSSWSWSYEEDDCLGSCNNDLIMGFCCCV